MISRKSTRAAAVAVCGCAGTLLTTQSASAGLVFGTGFEPAGGYTANLSLAGQSTSNPPVFVADNRFLATGTVANAVATYDSLNISHPATNTQLAQLASTGIDGNSLALVYPNLTSMSPAAAGTPILDASVSLLSQLGTNGNGSPVFGLTLLDGATNSIVDLYVGANGVVQYDDNATPTLKTATYTASPTAFTNYDVRLNYNSLAYTIFANNAQIGSGVFAGTTFRTAGFNASAFTVGTTSQGVGLYDGLSITTTAVPEPASVSVLAAGAAALAVGRRRRGRLA